MGLAALATGIASLTRGLRAAAEHPEPYAFRQLLLETSMFVVLLSLFLSWLNRESSMAIRLILGSIGFFGTSAAAATIPWMMHAEPGRILHPKAAGFFLILGGLPAAYYIILTGVFSNAWFQGRDLMVMKVPVISSLFIFILLAMAICYSFAGIRRDKDLKKTIPGEWAAWRDFRWICIILLPAAALLSWFRGIVPAIESVVGPMPGHLIQYGFFIAFFITTVRITRARSRKSDSPIEAIDRDIPGLTARETEVARLLARGLSYRQLADTLCISMHTVQTHVKNIYRKMEVGNKTELSRKLNTMFMGWEGD